MSISSETSEVDFAGNASTTTAYSIPFRFDDSAWLDVSTVASDGTVTALTLGAGDFTVGGDGSTATGTLTTTVAVPATTTLRIRRITPRTSTQDLEFTGTIPAEVTEANLDKGRMIDQDHERRRAELEERSLRVPDGETLAQLAAAASRAELVVCFDENGAVELLSKSAVLAAGGGAPTGVGIPDGGSADQVLAKLSTTDQDVGWKDVGDLNFTLPLGTEARSVDDRLGEGRVSVAEFGTIDPTGVADSQPAFQAAFEFAYLNNVPLYIPPGTYLLEAFEDGTTHILCNSAANYGGGGAYNATNPEKLDVIGLGRVVLKTVQNSCTVLKINTAHNDSRIENVRFLCERPTFADTDTFAILLAGAGTTAVNMLIDRCVFDGFRQSLRLGGTRGLTVTRCRFLAWQGRDSAYSSVGEWNAHIASYASDSQRNADVRIINNFFSGYSGTNGIGTDAPNTGQGMENAILGHWAGLTFIGNILENFDYELVGASIWPGTNPVDEVQGINISGNTFYCVQPSGAAINWAIRCGTKNALIANNVFVDARKAIFVYPSDDEEPEPNVVIRGNYIECARDVEPSGGVITISTDTASASGHRLENPVVDGNTIVHHWTTAATSPKGMIHVSRSDNFVITNNKIIFDGFTSDATYKVHGIDINSSAGDNNLIMGNYVQGCDYFIRDGGGTNGNVIVTGNEWDTVSGFVQADLDSGFVSRTGMVDSTFTAGGTTGVQTINKSVGSINFAASDGSKVVNNSLVTTSSIILATVATNDSTMTSVQAVPTSGGITFHANAAATAETRVNFWVIN